MPWFNAMDAQILIHYRACCVSSLCCRARAPRTAAARILYEPLPRHDTQSGQSGAGAFARSKRPFASTAALSIAPGPAAPSHVVGYCGCLVTNPWQTLQKRVTLWVKACRLVDGLARPANCLILGCQRLKNPNFFKKELVLLLRLRHPKRSRPESTDVETCDNIINQTCELLRSSQPIHHDRDRAISGQGGFASRRAFWVVT